MLEAGAAEVQSQISRLDEILFKLKARLEVIANAGHLSNMEHPDVFNAHVRRFCLSA